MTEKILFVDDDVNILSAFKRALRKQFDLDFAMGGFEGLDVLKERGPFAAVVSDLRMPQMDGVEFLAQVRKMSPDTVRLMLTGNADIDAAMAAVNEGNIFRFLGKPVQNEALIKALKDALRQYNLITAERVLLQKTLSGGIKVMTDVLSLVNPIAFSRASRLKGYVEHITTKLGITDAWQVNLAAMLSQIGCVALPSETLEKVYAGKSLSLEEREVFASHPRVAQNLLENIPRLDKIARIIGAQQEPFDPAKSQVDPKDRDLVELGAQILRLTLDFDQWITRGLSRELAIGKMKASEKYDPLILKALDDLEIVPAEMAVRYVTVGELQMGMVIYEDVRTVSGALVVAKGQEINFSVLEHLRRFSQKTEISEPFRVMVPNYATTQS